MRTAVLLATASCLALVGCGGDGEKSVAAPGSPTSSAAMTTSPAEDLSEADEHLCERVVADAGDAYNWLVTLEREGSISADLSTPGYIDAYQLGSTADALGGGQAESPELNTAMQMVIREGRALSQAIDDQAVVSPVTLRTALDYAADVCAEGGVEIEWQAS